MSEFDYPGVLVDAAAVPGAQLFVFPDNGPIEAIFVLTPDRMVWELRTDNAVGWFDAIDLERSRPSIVELEAALAAWCEWVPRAFRGVILGIESLEDAEESRH